MIVPFDVFLLLATVFFFGAVAGWDRGHRAGVQDERRRQASWRTYLERGAR